MDLIEEIRVELGLRCYTVTIGEGMLGRLAALVEGRAWKKAALVTDSNVGPLYAPAAIDHLRGAGLETVVLEVPAGEASKTAERALEIIDRLVDSSLTRSDVVVALGGGVVGDLAGFAASVFKRGVDVVEVPTTLMAMVDSSIGGKTGVNLPAAKNQVGTFHQPVAVISDMSMLGTLTAREFTSGLAEVAKYSVLTTRDWGRFFREDPVAVKHLAPDRLARVIAECAREKAALVAEDELDTGVRQYLNYGHTLGHALEADAAYGGTYSHGEAVSIGMVYAAIVSEKLGVGRPGLVSDHLRLLGLLGLPVRPFEKVPDFDDLAARMARDKKSAGQAVMVLLEDEGRPVVCRDIEKVVLEDSYADLNRVS
jgi:3-dehydroquinate synthase